MPLFKYTAVDADGNAVEGTIEAGSAHASVAELSGRGLRVHAVEPAEARGGRFLPKGALTWEEVDLFSADLAAIAGSGLPLASSLESLAGDLKNTRLQAVMQRVRSRLESGSSLAEALESDPKSFPGMYRGIIRAGERSGNLSGVLSHLCTYSARMVELKHGFQEVLAYPIVVLAAVFAVVGFILWYIVPEFMAFYEQFDATFPAPTRLLVFLSTLLRDHGTAALAWGLGGAVGLGLLGYLAGRTVRGSYQWDWFKFHVPIFGRRNHAAAVARFSRSLGLLLASEVPVLESLELASEAADNAVLETAVRRAAGRVANGERITDSLAETGFFTGTYCWMLDHAERAGTIESALSGLADDCEQDVERRDKVIISMAGPVAIVILGLLVGFVVFALYLPIYTVGDYIAG